MKFFKKNTSYITLALLAFLVVLIWTLALFYHNHNNNLKVVFLDVGQGDSIYIEAPNGKQMLIDGGPDAKVLSSLAKVMPFGDRSIDLILTTHADSDHIGGFPLILDNYKVKAIIQNGAIGNSNIFSSLENKIKKNHISEITARRGTRIVLDDKRNIYFDILFPDRDVSSFDSNDGSIVGKLVYENESFMLTGDATTYTENLIEWNENDTDLHSNILKLGHHGSKTSSSELWLEKVDPEIAIISAGKNNRYGHPGGETLDKLDSLHIPYISTADLGNIIFETDGNKLVYIK